MRLTGAARPSEELVHPAASLGSFATSRRRGTIGVQHRRLMSRCGSPSHPGWPALRGGVAKGSQGFPACQGLGSGSHKICLLHHPRRPLVRGRQRNSSARRRHPLGEEVVAHPQRLWCPIPGPRRRFLTSNPEFRRFAWLATRLLRPALACSALARPATDRCCRLRHRRRLRDLWRLRLARQAASGAARGEAARRLHWFRCLRFRQRRQEQRVLHGRRWQRHHRHRHRRARCRSGRGRCLRPARRQRQKAAAAAKSPHRWELFLPVSLARSASQGCRFGSCHRDAIFLKIGPPS